MVKISNTTSDREVRYLKRTIKKHELDELKIKFLKKCIDYYKDRSDYYENYSKSMYNNYCQMSQYYYDLCDKYVSVSADLDMLKKLENNKLSSSEIINDLNSDI
tara:strand:+ start:20 stop:331 length:312 start_codon:yes stop_codon:yes gene_type:complete